jgi:hypothetical protein
MVTICNANSCPLTSGLRCLKTGVTRFCQMLRARNLTREAGATVLGKPHDREWTATETSGLPRLMVRIQRQ